MPALRTVAQRRWLNLAGAGSVVGLIAYALFAQYVLDLEACPLCILQRVAFVAAGLVFLVAGVHSPAGAGARVYAGLGVATAGTGAGIAGWHVYIQQLPADRVPSCGPGLDYLFDAFSPFEVLEMIFTGSGECAVVNWSFLGLSMPAWALVWFILLGGLAVFTNWTRVSR
jgi:disulfide bond formation protein DsbB